MKKSRNITEFKQLNNNQQLNELTLRLEGIRKDYMKFFKLLSCKHFNSLNEEEKTIFREYKNNCYSHNAYKNYCEKLKKMNKLYLKKAYFENDTIYCPYEKGMLIGEYELLEV